VGAVVLAALLLVGCAGAPPPAPSSSSEIRKHADAIERGLVDLRVALRPFAVSTLTSCELLGHESVRCVQVRELAMRLVAALDEADAGLADYRASRIPYPRLLDLAEEAIALAAHYAQTALEAFQNATRRGRAE
jgi:hypothetical protein